MVLCLDVYYSMYFTVLESLTGARESSDDDSCEIAVILGALLAASLIALVISLTANGIQFIQRR